MKKTTDLRKTAIKPVMFCPRQGKWLRDRSVTTKGKR